LGEHDEDVEKAVVVFGGGGLWPCLAEVER
jgi:hypothetical protein